MYESDLGFGDARRGFDAAAEPAGGAVEGEPVEGVDDGGDEGVVLGVGRLPDVDLDELFD